MSEKQTRRVVCVDMDAFFASVEQWYDATLRGKPVAVTNGKHGGCIITSSYEARAFGVRTGMRFAEARALCPELIQCASKPERYTNISKRLMYTLEALVSPDIEVFSVDEAFLDVSFVCGVPKCSYALGQWIVGLVRETFGLPCSVGVSINKTLAKYAAKCKKPRGVTVIAPEEISTVLHGLPVEHLCGIGPKISSYLARFGVHTCDQVALLPVSVLSKRWGYLGQRLWLMCSGKDPDLVHSDVREAKSMGHGKRLPPGCVGREAIRYYLHHMASKLTHHLKLHGLFAGGYWIAARHSVQGWQGMEVRLTQPGRDYWQLVDCIGEVLQGWDFYHPYTQVQITATSVTSVRMRDLFSQLPASGHTPLAENSVLHTVLQDIKQKFGTRSIVPARLARPMHTPDVIAPSWKPQGTRQLIEKSV